MKVKKKKGNFGTEIILEEDSKFIRFNYGGNGDLYCSIHSKEKSLNNNIPYNYFIITKENNEVYRLFKELFDDIENINIFDDDDDIIPYYIETEEEKEEYLEKQRKFRENQKNKYRLYNNSHYNELFDSENRTITWYSDETSPKVANILNIKQEDDTFRLDFYTQPYIEEYDEDFYSEYYITIRFRNSGSLYDPFNIVFMKLYNSLSEIEDINDIEHQTHTEASLCEKRKKLVKN